jgi:hypothetical protein|tara:strand:+ start:618 stop:773 length:156 start_codon:yes stop_codon:yes gene_type:complete
MMRSDVAVTTKGSIEVSRHAIVVSERGRSYPKDIKRTTISDVETLLAFAPL